MALKQYLIITFAIASLLFQTSCTNNYETTELSTIETQLPAPIICDGTETEDCMEDPIHRWNLLQEQAMQRQIDSNLQQKHCDECKEICQTWFESNDDVLLKWKCMACERDCSEGKLDNISNDVSEKPRYDWNIHGKKDIGKLLKQKE